MAGKSPKSMEVAGKIIYRQNQAFPASHVCLPESVKSNFFKKNKKLGKTSSGRHVQTQPVSFASAVDVGITIPDAMSGVKGGRQDIQMFGTLVHCYIHPLFVWDGYLVAAEEMIRFLHIQWECQDPEMEVL